MRGGNGPPRSASIQVSVWEGDLCQFVQRQPRRPEDGVEGALGQPRRQLEAQPLLAPRRALLIALVTQRLTESRVRPHLSELNVLHPPPVVVKLEQCRPFAGNAVLAL